MYIFILKNWRTNNMIKRNEAKILVPVISAYAEGKILQYKEKEEWRDIEDSEGLSINTIINEAENYRIKPEPKYRPFANTEECWAEMLKHQPFGWVKSKENGYYSFITMLNNRFRLNGYDGWRFDDTIKKFTFADGTTFGVKVEE